MADDLLTGFPDAHPAATRPAPAPTPVASAFPIDDGAAADPLRRALGNAADTTPAAAARVFKLRLQTGLPADVIGRNVDEIERQAAARNFDPVKFRANNPGLSSWMQADPQHAALAADDLIPLTKVERTLGFTRRVLGDTSISLLKGAVSLPEAAVGLADIATLGYAGKILADDRGIGFQPKVAKAFLNTYYSNAQTRANLTVSEADGLLATAVAALENPSVIGHSVLESLPLMLSGSLATKVLPMVGPVLGGAIGEGAAQAGQAAEQSRQGRERSLAPVPGQLAAGNVDLYAQPKVTNKDGSISTVDSSSYNIDGKEVLLPSVTPDGRHLTDPAAIVAEYRKTGRHLGMFDTPEAATAYASQLHEDYAAGKYDQPEGTISAKQAVLAASSGIITGAIGAFGGRLAQKLGIADIDTMLAAGTVSAPARRNLVTQIVYGAIEEGLLEEFPQSVQEQIHQNYADGRPLTEGVANAAVMGTLAGAAMGGGANAFEHFTAHTERAAGPATERTLTQLGEAVKEAKLPTTSPEAFAAYVAHATDGTAGHTVFAKRETWDTYWQEQGEDPRAKAIEVLGDATAYDAGAGNGEPIAIPMAQYASTLAGTDHNAFWAKEASLDDPDAMNAREATELSHVAPEEVPPPAPWIAELRAQVTASLAGGAFTPTDAGRYADLLQAGVATVATAAGEDPNAVYRSYGIETHRPDLEQLPPLPGEPTRGQVSRLSDQAPFGNGGIVPEGVVPTERQAIEPPVPMPVLEPAPAGTTASFLGHGPDGPIYSVDLGFGPTTRSAKGLTELGVAVPETPTDTGEHLTGDQIRQQLLGTPEGKKAVELRTALHEAHTDPLTGIPNRRAFDKAIAAAEADPATSVAVFDVNGFKGFNDQAGHSTGDLVLKDMAAALTQAATEFGVSDRRVFRWGGDEFVVLGPTATLDAIKERAVAIFGTKTAETYQVAVNGPPLNATISGHVGQTFKEADDALNKVKDARKAAAKAAAAPPVVDPLTEARTSLERTGVAYGPAGLKVRVLPRVDEGRFELEVTEKGKRTFEGDYPLPEAQAAGAAKLVELTKNPTKAVKTPQIVPTPKPRKPVQPDVATAPVPAQTEGDSNAPVQADSPGPAPTERTSQPGEPASRPGDARAQDVAGQQPDAPQGVPDEPQPSKPARKRRPSTRRPGARAGADTAVAGADAGAGGGVHAPVHVDTADVETDPAVADAHARGEAPRHFVIDDAAALTEGGWIQKLENNLGAIRLLRALEREGRMATDAEQAVLTRYIGWGHTNLAPVVDPRAGALRERDPRLQKAHEELSTLLTAAELKELGESTPNAHYSFSDLPRAMWAAVQHLGFKSGSILEPAVGTGHFLGTIPGTILAQKRTRLWGVEKEPIAAGIARQLYQDAHVQTSPLQEANLPDNYFDLQISNVPFGRIAIFDPAFVSPDRKPLTSSVHNYYFGKALDMARPGGIIAFVTSRYTMDSRSDLVRSFLAKRADFLGAVRLPDQAFKKTAGTDVVTDIIFLQKRAADAPAGGQRWIDAPLNETLSPKDRNGNVTNAIHTNEYFQAHPEQVLGEQNLTGSMARTAAPQYNVQGTIDYAQLEAGMRAGLPEGVYRPSTVAPRKLATTTERDVKQGSFQVDGGKLYFYDKGTLSPAELPEADVARAKNFVQVRDTYQTVLDTMVRGGTDAELKTAQAALLGKYKFFVATHGPVNLRTNSRVIDLDPNGGRILALENIDVVRVKGRQAQINVTGLADIFSKRTYLPVVEPTAASSPAAALTQSLAWRGGVDLAYIQGLTGQTEAATIAALGDSVYQDPATRAWIPRAEYLSGDVTTKLAQAEAAATTETRFADNVTALTKVLPAQFTPEDFPVPFGATWVPVETYRAFLADEARASVDVTLVNTETRVKFYAEGSGQHEFLPPGANFGEWVAAALNGELPVLSKKVGDATVRDEEGTALYRESLAQLRERWAEWWPADPAASEQLTKIYNGLFNRDTPYVADGAHLVLPNANPNIKLRPWQKNVIWRTLQTGNTLMAHAVGAGKTFAMAAVAGEWKRQGLANKPLIVAPNHLTEQWRRAFLALYPAARILVPSKEDFTPSNRKRLTARIANNDWDAVVMAQSHFLSVGVKLETLKAFINEQETQLLADGSEQMSMTTDEFNDLVTSYGAGDKQATQALSSRNAPRSVKDIARGILTLRARLQKRLNQAKKGAPVTFEELGVDGLLIDEAHLYKNLYFSTSKNNIAGLKGSDADRAMDMFLKVRSINQASNSRNVVFATGTPVSNAISELYTMFRYLAQSQLDRMGMAGFDSWANGNAEAQPAMEPSPGGGYKERTRLRKWSNLRELSAQFRKFADVVTTEDLVKSGEITLPDIKNGRPTVVALDAHPDMPAFMEELRDRIEALKTGKVDPKDDNHLLITTQAGLAAIDLRLVKPDVAPDPNGRINVAAREIAERYHASTKSKGVQIVFLDVGIPNAKTMPPLAASIIGGKAVDVPVEAADPDDTSDDVVDPEAEAEEAMGQIAAAGTMRDLYGDLKRLLIEQGIKPGEIAYVHQARNPYEQGKRDEATRSGKIRVLMASTSKGATGMNVQDKLIALHHLDVPWRPADMEQREGRILRQGNENKVVEIVRYVTKKSFDEYRWGLLAQKQGSIVQLMKGELTSLDDVDPAQLDMMVAQALASGDPRTLEMLNKEREVKGLRVRYLAFTRKLNAARRAVTAGTNQIETYIARRDAMIPLETAVRAWAEAPTIEILTGRGRSYGGERDNPVTFDWKDADSRKAGQAAIEAIMLSEPYEDSVSIGSAGPFQLVLNKGGFDVHAGDKVTTKKTYFVTAKIELPDGLSSLGSTPDWNVGSDTFPDFRRSLDSYFAVARIEKMSANLTAWIARETEDVARQKEIAGKPFPQGDLLKKREEELSALRVALGVEQAAAPAPDEPPTKEFGQPIDPPDAPTPPPAGETRRGNIQFSLNPSTGLISQTRINLLTHANLSTFLHETGHFFLELFGDMVDRVKARDPETLNDEQKRLVADYEGVLERFKITRRDQLTTEHHEQWAREFESYLRDGNAPSVELQPAFQRFRQWLLGVYPTLKRLGGSVSPEVKGMFDRLLASEDAIAEVERQNYDRQLLTTPEQAGMSPQRFAQYRDTVAAAAATARERLDRKMAAEVRQQQSAEAQAARAAIEVAVVKELQSQPVYQARAAITTGLQPDGSPLFEGAGDPIPLRLQREPLVAQFGDERIANLPAGIVATEGGADPELIASSFGFSSADELLTALEQAPPLETAVAAEVDKRFAGVERSIMTDGTLNEEAQAAHANEDRDAVIRAEIKALWRTYDKNERAYERRWLEAEAKLRIAIAEGKKQAEIDKLRAEVQALKKTSRGGAAAINRALPSAEAMKLNAEQRIAGTVIRDLKPQTFWAASRQAAKRAVETAARQDIPGAIVAKTQELTNLALYREARRVRAVITAATSWVAAHDTHAARAQTGKAGQDYLDQWDGLLDRYEFKKVSQKILDRRTQLSKWIASQEALGLPVLLPEELRTDAGRTNYQTLTVDSFIGITDGLKMLLHLARLKGRLMRASAQRSFEAVRDELAESIRDTPARKLPLEFRPADQKWRALADGIASHATLSTISYAIDNHEHGGAFWEAIVRPANEAASAEETRFTEAGTAYQAILEQHYPGRQILTFGDKVFIPAIGDSLSKEGRLALAQNWGNQTSRDRVLADPMLNWSPDQVQAVLDTLDKNDWDFVQAHWNFLETFWPEIKEKAERLTGLAPEKVDALPVDTKFGTYAGGYHPLVYDNRKSPRVGRQEAVSEAKLAVVGAALMSTTRRGHEISRRDHVELPLRLDMAATTMHLSQVIHDLTHHEMLIDTTRLLRDSTIAKAIHETQGDIVYGKLGRLFNDIATGDRAGTRPTLVENGATWLRTRAQIAGLGWNFWTALQQPLGLFNGVERVGVKWVAKGSVRWLRDAVSMENTVAMVMAKSPMMRGRFDTASQDLHDVRKTLGTPGGWFDRLVRTVTVDHATQATLTDSFLWMISLAQRVADMPTWLGEYEKQLTADPTDDATAIARADQAVLDSQGGGQIKDLAEVQRGGPVAKLFMTFASYGVTVLNASGRQVGKTDFKSPASVATLLGHLSLLYIVPSLLTEVLRCGVGRAKCSEVPQFLERVAAQSVSTALNGMLYVREAAADVSALMGQDVGPRGYEGTAGTRVFQVLSQLATQIEQGKLDEGLEKAIFAASGVLFRYPAAQVQRTVDGFVALEDGKTKNPLALVFGPPQKGARGR